jgi:hypothetical protein
MLTAAQRKQNQRDREAGREQTYQNVDLAQKARDLAIIAELDIKDATEKYYYKSECRTRAECYRLYCQFGRGKKIISLTRIGRGRKALREKLSFNQWLRVRDLCRTNLFFLAKYFLGFEDLVYRVHKPVCDAFVKKDFRNTYHKDYTLKDVRTAFDRMRERRFKNSLILDPRAFFKTSINLSDIVQWLLNCPDVKILLLTAENKRATDLLVAVKKYFKSEEDEPSTGFQYLFPEYLIPGVDGTSTQPLNCPARKESLVGVDHSLWVKSQSSQKTGSHADVVKRDDIVTPENSTTTELRAAVKESADDTANLVLEHGFVDTIGTRYTGGKDPDYYGVMLQREQDSAEEDKDLKYFVRPCWYVKPEYKDLRLKELTSIEMVDLVFPEQGRTPAASFKGLRRKLLDNERSFRNQQLNEPIDSEEDSPWAVHFTEEFLRAHTYPMESAPKEGKIFQTCDLSYGEKSTSDFSVIVTAMIYLNAEGKYAICILDVDFGKWKSSELSTQICFAYRRWPMAEQICIERVLGAPWLYENIGHVGQKYGVPEIKNKIILWPVDVSPNAKRTRIKSLEFLMADNRLHIVSNAKYIDELYKQFTNFSGEKSTASKKDDIPDGCSFMLNYLPKSALKRDVDPAEAQKEAEEMRAKELQKAQYERMFGSITIVASQILAVVAELKPDPRRAGMSKIFGGNGMRA